MSAVATPTYPASRPDHSLDGKVVLPGGWLPTAWCSPLVTGPISPKSPYLGGVLEEVKLSDGFPVLDEALQTSLDGLYITGFSATQDFGPFFGFVKRAPTAATLIVRDLLSRR